MIYTDLIDRLEVSDIPPGGTNQFSLGVYVPNGSIRGVDIECRLRPVGRYWLPWVPVDAWNNTTRMATVTREFNLDLAQFRRVTPRYDLVLDPLVPETRVSKKYLQVNADQGLFVSEDWAREFLFDPYVVMFADPGDGPNQLGLVQLTQNHYGPTADYSRTSWNFQFAGGYIDRSHVKAQAHLPSGWVSLLIDPSENDPLNPSSAPFRFVGDYQLWLDLASLGEPVDGLVLYRHTPRGVQVSTPDDAMRIRASNMEPSARHGVFVAVEIGEELAKRAPTCECMLYYTSTLYPVNPQLDLATIGHTGDLGVVVWGTPEDLASIGHVVPVGGTLVSAINYVVYDPPVSHADLATIGHTLPLSGTLVSTINYVVYDPPVSHADRAGVLPVTPQSGTLAVVVAYIVYNPPVSHADLATVNHVLPISGTLV